MIVQFYTDISDGWRSKWIRSGSDGPAHHVTITVGEYTMHVDPLRQGWFKKKFINRAYRGVYKHLCGFHIPYDRGYRPEIPTTRYPSLEVIMFKYLGGPKPKVCAGLVAEVMTANLCPAPFYVDPNHLLEWFNDRSWTKRQGPDGQEPPY